MDTKLEITMPLLKLQALPVFCFYRIFSLIPAKDEP
jgi:hypothetical protein